MKRIKKGFVIVRSHTRRLEHFCFPDFAIRTKFYLSYSPGSMPSGMGFMALTWTRLIVFPSSNDLQTQFLPHLSRTKALDHVLRSLNLILPLPSLRFAMMCSCHIRTRCPTAKDRLPPTFAASVGLSILLSLAILSIRVLMVSIRLAVFVCRSLSLHGT